MLTVFDNCCSAVADTLTPTCGFTIDSALRESESDINDC